MDKGSLLNDRVRSNAVGFEEQRSLWSGFIRSAQRFPQRPAVVAEGKVLTYEELYELACRIAATIQRYPECSPTPLTAVFAYRSTTAFAGVLGALLAGNGYVPLNRTFPEGRTQVMFERSESRTLVVDAKSLPQLSGLLEGARERVLVMLPDMSDVAQLEARWPKHLFVGAGGLQASSSWREAAVHPDSLAYLLFTSGSTGTPKGVAVAERNVLSFLDYMVDRYEVTENDRLSQMFDMTFDLSAFDMFVAWERGACVCCPSQKELIKPDSFIKNSKLTMWFSVPSTAVFMKQLGLLKAGRYPELRVSLFCGEPLPVSSIQAWCEAAPNSIVENLYGPTELTIACTLYRWDSQRSASESEMGIAPIGYPYPGMTYLVVDEELNEVVPGGEGELLMNGPQMSLGYWRDTKKTSEAFITPPGQTEVYYRTGDRVRRPRSGGPLIHLGRIDSQIKVLGHRVELGEIEAVVRKHCGSDAVVAVGWPFTSSGYGGVEVFIEGREQGNELRDTVRSELPEYMVPRRFHFKDRLARNSNGKLDRKAISKSLEGNNE
ncbi:MAG: Peptide synthetase [Candidatus Acidoferrum typicum]|nr:Peptide synthetase [Candidatus Acidoferrum typicum]